MKEGEIEGREKNREKGKEGGREYFRELFELQELQTKRILKECWRTKNSERDKVRQRCERESEARVIKWVK